MRIHTIKNTAKWVEQRNNSVGGKKGRIHQISTDGKAEALFLQYVQRSSDLQDTDHRGNHHVGANNYVERC